MPSLLERLTQLKKNKKIRNAALLSNLLKRPWHSHCLEHDPSLYGRGRHSASVSSSGQPGSASSHLHCGNSAGLWSGSSSPSLVYL